MISDHGPPCFFTESSTDGSRGGYIFVHAKTLLGHGHFSANGGNGFSSRGGKGGRIEIASDSSMEGFTGTFEAKGGVHVDSSPCRAAAGAILLQYVSSLGAPSTELSVDNGLLLDETEFGNGEYCPYIEESAIALRFKSDSESVDFDKVSVLGSASVSFGTVSDSRIIVKEMIGDYSGLIAIPSDEELEMKTTADARSDFSLPVALKVEKNASIQFPSKLRISHIHQCVYPSSFDFELRGSAVGVSSVTIGKSARSFVGSGSSISVFKDSTTDFNSFQMSSLKLLANSSLTFAVEPSVPVSPPISLTLLESLDVRFGAVLQSGIFKIISPNITVSYGGRISVDSWGNVAGNGDGSPVSDSNYGIRGASHGGCGGSSDPNGNADTELWCSGYGSIYSADKLGSGGEIEGTINSCDTATESFEICTEKLRAGAGGGVISIDATYVRNDGFISANGGNGVTQSVTSAKIGGGSGGSISLVVSETFRGNGLFEARGGSGMVGSSGVGGGGGGRIIIKITEASLYTGTYSVMGGRLGESSNSDSLMPASGGSGTIFIDEKRETTIGGTVTKVPFQAFIVDNNVVKVTEQGMYPVHISSRQSFLIKINKIFYSRYIHNRES